MEVSDKQALLNKNGSGIGRECGVTPQVRHFKTGVLQAPYRGGNGTRVPHACGHDAQAALAGELTPGDVIGPGMLNFSGSLRVFVAVEVCLQHAKGL